MHRLLHKRIQPALPLCAALFATSIALSTTISTAHAGGIGVVTTGGVHGARAYYYNEDGDQGVDRQLRPNAGAGIEILIGDGTDKIQGLMRLYANTDWPTAIPEFEGVTADEAIYPAAHEQDPRIDGTVSIGVQWGLWGEPEGFQVVATTLFGSAFMTQDNLEYFMGEGGIGATYYVSERIQLAGTVAGAVRHRKQFSHNEGAFLSARYMFD